ncbi:MAG: NPCBM/NEW2 domain-containing protein, partial [Myxococcota bacterium]|nr:NPCBM/NEW2 domain-containing protein [Myxococcota bacterium]
SIAGQTYAKGLGVHAASEVRVALGGACSLFTAKVGIDDETAGQGSVVFQIQANGDNLFESEVMRGTMAARPVSVDVTGKSEILLVVTDAEDGNNFDHADWADAKLICK